MLLEHQIISKVLEESNFYVLNKYNIRKEDFTVLGEVYDFVHEYVRVNKGALPDYRTVVNTYDEFDYMPEVVDSFQYLCKSLKQNTAKRLQYELLQKQLPTKFSELNGADLNKWLLGELELIGKVTDTVSSSGTNFAQNGAERLQYFEDSKAKINNVCIPTPYPTLSELLAGGFFLGDYVLLQAFTNRGKSWIASHLGYASWKADFGVLHYSPELSKMQQLQRLDTLSGHFDNIGLRTGEIADEDRYRQHLSGFNESNTIPYLIKTMEDLPNGLTLEQIEADLLVHQDIKMIIIDGFNLMTHSGRDGNRNNMSNTSRQLRQIFGRHNVVGVVVHQTGKEAEKENMTEDEVGNRIPTAPKIHQYSETISVIQDACTVLGFDQIDGYGVIQIAKCRQPSVGKSINLNCNFNFGFIEETPPSFDF